MPLTVIRASAGSGKTYKLAVSYLQLLLRAELSAQPLDPSQILATTFTRAAAAEILDRVLQLLSNAVLAGQDCAALSQSTGLPLTPEICGRVLGHLAARLDRLTISTMDSFFGQIAKAFSAELGMAPGWQMAVNEAEAEVQRATVYSLLGQTDNDALLAALTTYRKQQVGSSIKGVLDNLSGSFQQLPNRAAAAMAFHQHAPRLWEAGEIAEAARVLATYRDWAPRTQAGKINARWQKALEDLAAVVQRGQRAERVLDSTLGKKILGNDTFYGIDIPEILADAMSPLAAIAREEIQRQHRARMEAIEWLAACYRQARLSTLFEAAAYTFSDITQSVGRHALRQDSLYFRLGTKYQHVLFDEFQDTSRQQYEFFRPLLEEIGANGESSIFVVGDEKQAIYGWRGGDREIMHGPLENLGEKIGAQPAAPLRLSYRSSAAILNAVNHTFNALGRGWCPDKPVLEAAGRQWAQDFADHAPADRVANLQGKVRLFEVENDDGEDKDAALVAKAVDLVREHLQEDPRRNIAVLLRKRNLMSRLIAEIRRACPQVNVSGEGGNPLTDSRAVELILSLLTYLDHPGHTAARYHVLSCPARAAFGFPESVLADAKPGAEEWAVLEQIRRALSHQGLAESLRPWIRHAAFAANCTEYDLTRCEQLLELAREFDQRPLPRLSEFVEHVRHRRMERQGGSAVRIMTIHASKGLEFESVILLELDADQRRNSEPSVMEHEGALQLVPTKDMAELLDLQPLYDKKAGDDFMGELSVLYVGMTRARSFLDIVLRHDSKAPIAQLLRTGLKPGENQIIEAIAGLTARECDAANGRDASAQPKDPGIAKHPLAPPAFSAALNHHHRASYTTPSSREDEGLLSVSSILDPANRGAMKHGELIHAWLSQISWIENGLPTAPQLLSATKELWAHLSREQAAEEAERLLAKINAPGTSLHRVFSKTHLAPQVGVELWRERRFAIMDGSARSQELLTGSFDRVVIWQDASGIARRAEIIDFKTDRFSNQTERHALEERYRPQLAAYVRAASQLLHPLKPDHITAVLSFLNE